MSSSIPTNYLKSFFEKGRVIFNDKTKNLAQNKRLFRSVLVQLQTDHPEFTQEFIKENKLKIDHQNLIIELVL